MSFKVSSTVNVTRIALRRRALLQSVEKAFARDLHFAEGLVEVHPTVPQLWRCLDLLGLQRRQVQKTAEAWRFEGL